MDDADCNKIPLLFDGLKSKHVLKLVGNFLEALEKANLMFYGLSRSALVHTIFEIQEMWQNQPIR